VLDAVGAAHRARHPALDDRAAVDGDRLDAQRIDVAVAAWGCPPTKIAGRVEWMRGLRKWFCLGTTKDGYPKHPLYLAKDTELEAL